MNSSGHGHERLGGRAASRTWSTGVCDCAWLATRAPCRSRRSPSDHAGCLRRRRRSSGRWNRRSRDRVQAQAAEHAQPVDSFTASITPPQRGCRRFIVITPVLSPDLPHVVFLAHEPVLGRASTRAFAVSGFDTIEMSDALAAAQLVHTLQPSMVLVDCGHPQSSVFLDRLKQDTTTADIPVLALTHPGTADPRRPLHSMVDAVLLHPVTPNDLTCTARLLMERAALRRRVAAHRAERSRDGKRARGSGTR
jgi:CheY-like chemotaxis protein